MIKLDDILAIFIAALLTVSILLCSKTMREPPLHETSYPTVVQIVP